MNRVDLFIKGVKFLQVHSIKTHLLSFRNEEMQATGTNGLKLQIPVIDISKETEDIGHRLVDSVARYGFVFVRGEGLGFTPQILDDTFSLVRSDLSLLRHSVSY